MYKKADGVISVSNLVNYEAIQYLNVPKEKSFTLYNSYMDIYVSPKIKATVKSVGTIILLLFYSSLVDFYYIGPYIHNTLSQIKYTTEKMLVNGKDIENNFYEMNVMLYDTISFFNGLNRSFVKDM